jgi:hypothetical protein
VILPGPERIALRPAQPAEPPNGGRRKRGEAKRRRRAGD